MEKEQAKEKILRLIKESEELIPDKPTPNLKAIDGFSEVPEWHKFELEIWQRGEAIRQLLKENKELTKDDDIMSKVLFICLNKNAKRGRQSFIMLLWNKHYSKYAGKLVSQIGDKFVNGHVIEGLNKMKVPYYVEQVRPFCNDKTTWIRNQAQKYVDRYNR